MSVPLKMALTMYLRKLLWLIFPIVVLSVCAQEQPAKPVPTKCLAVKSIGSHAFRNVLLGGIAGALISKEQYQVVNAVGYPAQMGQKFHGSDLQTIEASGTKVVILNKKFTPEEVQKACQ